jgi:hypothetical protein
VFSESRLNHKDYLLLTLTLSNDRVSRNLPYFIWCKSYAKAREWCDRVSFALVVAIWLDLSPPLAGGDKGEGEILSNRNNYDFSPQPQSSPIKGEEVLGFWKNSICFLEHIDQSKPKALRIGNLAIWPNPT